MTIPKIENATAFLISWDQYFRFLYQEDSRLLMLCSSCYQPQGGVCW